MSKSFAALWSSARLPGSGARSEAVSTLYADELDSSKTGVLDVVAPHGWLRLGGCRVRGWRRAQEDALDATVSRAGDEAFFAVLDGHGGADVADFCARHMRQAYCAAAAELGDVNDALQATFVAMDAALAEGARLREAAKADALSRPEGAFPCVQAAASAAAPGSAVPPAEPRRAPERAVAAAMAAAIALTFAPRRALSSRAGGGTLGTALALVGGALVGTALAAAALAAGAPARERARGVARRACAAAAGAVRGWQQDAAAAPAAAAAAAAGDTAIMAARIRDATAVNAWECGSTAVCAVVRRGTEGDISVAVANAGACRGVLERQAAADGTEPSAAAAATVELTTEHRPTLAEEKRRILLADTPHSTVDAHGRIAGVLACSRAIGSLKFKAAPRPAAEQVLVPYPEVRTASGLTRGDLLLLASDGVWDCMSTQAALERVRAERRRLGAAAPTSSVCAALLDACLRSATRGGRGSDNMTVVIAEVE